MRYQTVDAAAQTLNIVASGLRKMKTVVDSDRYPLRKYRLARMQSAALDTTIRLLQHYPKQGWNYPDITIGTRRYPIEETVVVEKPFCKLMKFRRKNLPANAPKALFVAALSGHHATLSRETFEEFLPDHEVYVTDWTDARLVPIEDGRFGFEEYVSYVIEFLEAIGPGTHLIGLCQAGIPGLVAAAVMSEDGNPARPASMSFLGSPIDIRINPGLVSKISNLINPAVLCMSAIHRVPARYPGKGRLVYPGILQLGNFVTMSFRSHIESHIRYFKCIYQGDFESADKIRDFYDEYFSILDSTAEFYIETLERVFLDQQLPKGLMSHQGRNVTCDSIHDIPLFTVEGAKDNMVMIGQCSAAADLCTNLPDKLKESYVQEGVGHYGVFSGRLYREGVAPRVKAFIAAHHKPAPRRRPASRAAQKKE